MEVEQFKNSLGVKICYTQLDSRIKVGKAILSLRERKWKWALGPKDFEAVHGMSRVVRLIPDKLATAIAIHKEGLNKPEEDRADGSFLVELVANLVKIFAEKCEADEDEDLDEGFTFKSEWEIQGKNLRKFKI